MANNESVSSNQPLRDTCPKCGAISVVRINVQKRCNQCGHQWPPISNMQRGPTRRDVLNGTARYVPGRIIFFRSC